MILLLNECFPKNNTLHKIFNRNSIELSYSCMTDMKQKKDNRNKSCPVRKIKNYLLELAMAEPKHHAHLKENVCKRELCPKP